MEQRYQAVLEVLNDGASVTDVARRYGVARQTVHDWLRKSASEGLRGLADRSSRPLSCPHQIVPVVEARVVEMRRAHPWVGAAHDPVLARAREDRSAAGAHVDRALPGPPWAGHAPGPEAQAQRLQALGAVPVDGAVADGRCPISRPTRPIPDVHHLFSDCPSGQQIPPANREEGTNGRPLCDQCRDMSG